jgi:glycine/D-amino acid oxidase-like deaminating enzyme
VRANVALLQGIGIDTRVAEPDEIARLIPGAVVDGIAAAAWEPRSGYADPSGTAAGLLEAARRLGARYIAGCRVAAVVVEGDRVTGVETDRGRFDGPVVVDVAGAWAPALAATVGVEVPVQTWRHDTAFFGLPEGRTNDLPILIDEPNGVYFRPEGRELLLVGLEAANEVGGSPDRPHRTIPPEILEEMIERLCRRVPWMRDGTFRIAHGGQDGITPLDQRPILGRAGPDGFILACGFSGTGFKTAPAIGQCLAELILDGAATTVDISGYAFDRFATGRALRGPHPYGDLWR